MRHGLGIRCSSSNCIHLLNTQKMLRVTSLITTDLTVCCSQWQHSEIVRNKMAYIREQHVFLVKYFTTLLVIIKFGMNFQYFLLVKLQNIHINMLVNNYETTGTVVNNKKHVVSKKKLVKTPENIVHVPQSLTHSPGRSVRCLSQIFYLEESSTYRTDQKGVKLFPYKIQIQQSLGGSDEGKPAETCDIFLHVQTRLQESCKACIYR